VGLQRLTCLNLFVPTVTLYAQRSLCPLRAEPINRIQHRAPKFQEVRTIQHECDGDTFSCGQHAEERLIDRDHADLRPDIVFRTVSLKAS
jgi:hypothetical protein